MAFFEKIKKKIYRFIDFSKKVLTRCKIGDIITLLVKSLPTNSEIIL